MCDKYNKHYDPSRMTYKLVVEDKLHWTFRLYDQDGSGEIDPDEMELIFTKFWSQLRVEPGTSNPNSTMLLPRYKINKQRVAEMAIVFEEATCASSLSPCVVCCSFSSHAQINRFIAQKCILLCMPFLLLFSLAFPSETVKTLESFAFT